MNKKQLIGLVVAGLVFAFVASASILTNRIAESMPKKPSFMETLLEAEDKLSLPTSDFIGVVDVQGTILDTASSPFTAASYNHTKTLELIDSYKNATNNKGILLTVNSPGGGVYESDALYLKLKEYKEATDRPIWTYMENQAASGGYYIAMASDKIVANRNTWTGSIGVIIGLSNYKELAEKIGYKEIYFTSGSNKTMGSATMELTKEQEEIFQSLVDESYDQFFDIVARGRGIERNELKDIADGRIYTAKQALKLNLIDGIDTYDNTVKEFLENTSTPLLYTPDFDPWGIKSLLGEAKSLRPKSDAEIVSEFIAKQGNGVPMYYADPGKY